MGLKEFYNGKKVFITGHTGFKGSWLLLTLRKFGAIVKGYALAPDNVQALYYSIKGDELCDSVIADIRDGEKLAREIAAFQPDILFHLAAQPLVIYSYQNPVETFDVNVMGTAHVLEAVRALKGKCSVIVVTTDKVYENAELSIPFKEDDKLGGHDPYSSSKACTEIVTASYIRSFFLLQQYAAHQKVVATGRAGNVIGGGDFATNRIVPDIVRALSAGEDIPVRNPGAVRPWQHVLDPLAGYMLLAMNNYEAPGTYRHAYNFGPDSGDELNVEELVKLAINNWGSGRYTISQTENALHEAGYLMLDNSLAREELNWIPRMSASEAIEKTIMWYKQDHAEKGNRKHLMEKDIEAYFNE